MATKKKKEVVTSEPKVVVGLYSKQTIENEKLSFEIDWDALKKHVNEALQEHDRKKLVEAAPFHPGYEGAVIDQPKKTKTKKTKAK
jgi:hypothetical protein